jgi:phosphoglycolate phosphatase-like HAD superfamily hydrolase
MMTNRQITNDVCRELAGTRMITQQDIENLNQMSFQEVAKVIGIPDNLIPVCLKEINKRLVKSYSSLALFPGIKQVVLELFKQNHTLAVITHNTENAVKGLLEKYEIRHCFSKISGAETRGDKADKLNSLLEEYPTHFTNRWMIGDSVGDMTAAKSADFRPTAVSWGFQSVNRLKTFSPDIILDSPEEILNLVSL